MFGILKERDSLNLLLRFVVWVGSKEVDKMEWTVMIYEVKLGKSSIDGRRLCSFLFCLPFVV